MEQRLGVDRAEELAVWMAVRRAANEENDVVVVTDRMRTVERFRAAKISNSIEVDLWNVMDERRPRGYNTRIEWAQRNDPGIVQTDQAAERGSRWLGVDLSLLVQRFACRKNPDEVEGGARLWQSDNRTPESQCRQQRGGQKA